MSEWRPEEAWDEQAKERLRDLDFDAMHASLETSEYYRNIYEAGADAILAALKQDSLSFRRGVDVPGGSGTWAFIPDVLEKAVV